MRIDSLSDVDMTLRIEEGIIDIFDTSQFAYSPDRHLTPPCASIKMYQDFKELHGISKSVLVHGLSYGHDDTPLKAFLEQLDPRVTRGIAVISRHTTDEEIQQLHDSGVRGIRLDLYCEKAMRDLDRQLDILRFYAERVAPWKWSVNFLQLEPANWHELGRLIPQLPVDVVVDHQAMMKASSMLPEGITVVQQPGMATMLKLLQGEDFWIKISAPYRSSEQGPQHDDMREVVRCLVDANPHRVVYGSDWPHTPRMKVRSREEALMETPFLKVDDGIWLRRLRDWLSEDEWHLLTVENPRQLYQF